MVKPTKDFGAAKGEAISPNAYVMNGLDPREAHPENRREPKTTEPATTALEDTMRNLGAPEPYKPENTNSDSVVFREQTSSIRALNDKATNLSYGGVATAEGARKAHEEKEKEAEEMHEEVANAFRQRQLRRAIRNLTRGLQSDRVELRELEARENSLRNGIREDDFKIENLKKLITQKSAVPDQKQAEIDQEKEKLKVTEAKKEEVKQEIQYTKETRDALDKRSDELFNELRDAKDVVAKTAYEREQLKEKLAKIIDGNIDKDNTSETSPKISTDKITKDAMGVVTYRGKKLEEWVIAGKITQAELDDYLKSEKDLADRHKQERLKVKDFSEQLDIVGKEVAGLKTYEDSLSKQLAELELQSKELKANIERLEKEKSQAQTELQDMQDKLTKMETARAEKQKDLDEVVVLRKELEKKIAIKEQILDRAEKLESGQITPTEYIYGKIDEKGNVVVAPLNPHAQQKVREAFEKQGIEIGEPSVLSRAWRHITGPGSPAEQAKAAAAEQEAARQAAAVGTETLAVDAKTATEVVVAKPDGTPTAAPTAAGRTYNKTSTEAFAGAVAPAAAPAPETPAPDTPAVVVNRKPAATVAGAPT